jgi:hypothetical protein
VSFDIHIEETHFLGLCRVDRFSTHIIVKIS